MWIRIMARNDHYRDWRQNVAQEMEIDLAVAKQGQVRSSNQLFSLHFLCDILVPIRVYSLRT